MITVVEGDLAVALDLAATSNIAEVDITSENDSAKNDSSMDIPIFIAL